MKPTELKLRPRDREKLRTLSHYVFDRLAINSPEGVHLANKLENKLLSLVVYGLAAATFFLTDQVIIPWVAGKLGHAAWPTTNNGLVLAISGGVSLLIVVLWTFGRGERESGNSLLQSLGSYQVFLKKVLDRSGRETNISTVEDWFINDPRAVLDTAARRNPTENALPPRIVAALQLFKTPPPQPKALILRRFVERKPWPMYLNYLLGSPSYRRPADWTKENHWLRGRAFRNAIKTSLLLNELGAELRDEVVGGANWRRDYRTNRRRQLTALFGSNDVPVRFRSGAPQYVWPDSKKNSSANETALYRVFHCIENPVSAPLLVVPVPAILAEFEGVIATYPGYDGEGADALLKRRVRVNDVIKMLAKSQVYIFGKRDAHTFKVVAEGAVVEDFVLRTLSGSADADDLTGLDWGLRWDPNRVDWSKLLINDQDGEVGIAFAVLIEAIERAGQKALKAYLRRGDTLVVDNLRCLVGRYEANANETVGWKRILNLPEAWWLCGYYGFRKSSSGGAHFEEDA